MMRKWAVWTEAERKVDLASVSLQHQVPDYLLQLCVRDLEISVVLGKAAIYFYFFDGGARDGTQDICTEQIFSPSPLQDTATC